jgi:hypothetical protein
MKKATTILQPTGAVIIIITIIISSCIEDCTDVTEFNATRKADFGAINSVPVLSSCNVVGFTVAQHPHDVADTVL